MGCLFLGTGGSAGLLDSYDDARFARDPVDLPRNRGGVNGGEGCSVVVSAQRLDLLRHVGPFVGDEHTGGPEERPGQVDEGGHVGDAAGEDCVVSGAVLRHITKHLGPGANRAGLCQCEVLDDALEEVDLLPLGVEQNDPRLRAGDADREAREAGATAQVKENWMEGEIHGREPGEGVEEVVGEDAPLVRPRDQVGSGIPAQEVLAVHSEQSDLSVIQVEAEMFRALDEDGHIAIIII